MIRVLVADDQPLIRQAVSDILDSHPNISVVGEAVDGIQAIRLSQQLLPDVVLMDIRMPHMDGIEATAAIRAWPSQAPSRVLILTTFEEDEYVLSALRAGASGFIGKGAEPEDIVKAVVAIHDGEALLSPVATRTLISRYIRPQPQGGTAPPQRREYPELALLTERERQVLELVARGHSNTDLAQELSISPHTAKTHVNRIMSKVHAHDRAQLVVLAYESGLLTPGVQ